MKKNMKLQVGLDKLTLERLEAYRNVEFPGASNSGIARLLIIRGLPAIENETE